MSQASHSLARRRSSISMICVTSGFSVFQKNAPPRFAAPALRPTFEGFALAMAPGWPGVYTSFARYRDRSAPQSFGVATGRENHRGVGKTKRAIDRFHAIGQEGLSSLRRWLPLSCDRTPCLGMDDATDAGSVSLGPWVPVSSPHPDPNSRKIGSRGQDGQDLGFAMVQLVLYYTSLSRF
jgi:hypothetical protein